MQLASATAPTAQSPAVGSITLGWYDAHGDYMVRHTTQIRVDEQAPVAPKLPAGSSIRDAIKAAAEAARTNTSPAGTPVGRAFAVMQAADGVLNLQPLTMTLEGTAYPVAIDGPLFASLGAKEVAVQRSTASLLAVVGATSWIDLTLLTKATPQPLPA